jgi:hypothetical protein
MLGWGIGVASHAFKTSELERLGRKTNQKIHGKKMKTIKMEITMENKDLTRILLIKSRKKSKRNQNVLLLVIGFLIVGYLIVRKITTETSLIFREIMQFGW